MNPKREDTPLRISRRKYEEKRKAERIAASVNFQTKIPRSDYEKIVTYLKEHNITKVELIYAGYTALMKEQGDLKTTT